MNITPTQQRQFEAQIAELIRLKKLPTLEQVQAAITETKAKYAPLRPSDFQNRLRIHGLRVAAEKIHREEFNRIVAPPPVQLQFPFLAARTESEVR
jgi:hypothetical protein